MVYLTMDSSKKLFSIKNCNENSTFFRYKTVIVELNNNSD